MSQNKLTKIQFHERLPWARLVEARLFPANCRRFVLDSGPPDGVAMIYFECYGEPEQCEEIVKVLLSGEVPE